MDLSGVDVDFLTDEEILELYNDVLDGNVNNLLALAYEYCQCLGYTYATCMRADLTTSYGYWRIVRDYSCK